MTSSAYSRVAADGEPAGEPGDAHPPPQSIREVGSCGFPCHGRVGGEDDLLDSALLDPALEAADSEIRRFHAVEGRERAPEDVVKAAKLMRTLERHDVDRLLDHADQRAVAPRVRAHFAKLLLGEVAAFATEAYAGLHVLDRMCELEGVVRPGGEEMKRQPLGRTPPDSGQLRQLGDEVLDRRTEHTRSVAVPFRQAAAG